LAEGPVFKTKEGKPLNYDFFKRYDTVTDEKIGCRLFIVVQPFKKYTVWVNPETDMRDKDQIKTLKLSLKSILNPLYLNKNVYT